MLSARSGCQPNTARVPPGFGLPSNKGGWNTRLGPGSHQFLTLFSSAFGACVFHAAVHFEWCVDSSRANVPRSPSFAHGDPGVAECGSVTGRSKLIQELTASVLHVPGVREWKMITGTTPLLCYIGTGGGGGGVNCFFFAQCLLVCVCLCVLQEKDNMFWNWKTLKNQHCKFFAVAFPPDSDCKSEENHCCWLHLYCTIPHSQADLLHTWHDWF